MRWICINSNNFIMSSQHAQEERPGEQRSIQKPPSSVRGSIKQPTEEAPAPEPAKEPAAEEPEVKDPPAEPQQPAQPAFFPTQIAQNGAEDEENSPPASKPPTIESPQAPPEPAEEKPKQDPHSLKALLVAFNSYDREEKGLIDLQQAEAILQEKTLESTRVKEYHLMSLPLRQGMVSFDEFLFVYVLAENPESTLQQKCELCRQVDPRLIDFLRLLNNYRKKSEKNGNYKEAKNSKKKVQEIRERELLRRNKYLDILRENQLVQAEEAQRTKFEELCGKWDNFMNDYQLTATDLLARVKQKQKDEIKEFDERTRAELASKMHYSKYLLELQTKERNLVKIQEYELASRVQQEIEEMRVREEREKQLADNDVVELRLKTLRKQQEATISSLLQKVQKDRNDHLKQRQAQTEKLMVRNKAQITEIEHRHNEHTKRLYQVLHNLNLDSDKHRVSKG